MKTLVDYELYYDDECPLCVAYTKNFVKIGLLEPKGRLIYREVDFNKRKEVDQQRARNEIALYRKTDGKVVYGIESIFTLLGVWMPFTKPLLNNRFFKYLIRKLYAFISYNRKVIVPGKQFEGYQSCSPDLNLKYRWLYIAFTWIVVSVVLTKYSSLLLEFVPHSSFYREFAICGGQIVVQGIIVFFIKRERLIYYLGNMMTISFFGAILLLPAFVLNLFIDNNVFYLLYFMIVAGLMLFEHIRRTKILEISIALSITWVLYRCIILLLIL